MDETVELLKKVTEAHGVPGYETEVRAVLQELEEPLGELSQDNLGSLICRQRGDGPKVMFIDIGATSGEEVEAAGVPTVVTAVAARHIHSHGAIIHRDDYDGAVQLVQALVKRLDQETVESLTR